MWGKSGPRLNSDMDSLSESLLNGFVETTDFALTPDAGKSPKFLIVMENCISPLIEFSIL